jgi:hypothetical protein
MNNVQCPLTATVSFCGVNLGHPFRPGTQGGEIDATSTGSAFKPNIDTGSNEAVGRILIDDPRTQITS